MSHSPWGTRRILTGASAGTSISVHIWGKLSPARWSKVMRSIQFTPRLRRLLCASGAAALRASATLEVVTTVPVARIADIVLDHVL